MPLYVYKCTSCLSEEEYLVPFSEKEKYLNKECNACGSNTMVSKLGKSSFRLKGKGWYKDGY